jgi:hypothetical protein
MQIRTYIHLLKCGGALERDLGSVLGLLLCVARRHLLVRTGELNGQELRAKGPPD